MTLAEASINFKEKKKDLLDALNYVGKELADSTERLIVALQSGKKDIVVKELKQLEAVFRSVEYEKQPTVMFKAYYSEFRPNIEGHLSKLQKNEALNFKKITSDVNNFLNKFYSQRDEIKRSLYSLGMD